MRYDHIEGPSEFALFIIDDVIPFVNILLAADATVRNIKDLKFIKNRIFRIIIFLTAVATLGFAVIYLFQMMEFDHVINPDPAAYSAYYVRPFLTFVIVLMNITSRYRRFDRGEDPK